VLAYPGNGRYGYTIGDLVLQQALLQKAPQGLSRIVAESAASSMLIIVGMPLACEQRVFNWAVAVNNGKSWRGAQISSPGTREFLQTALVASGTAALFQTIDIDGEEVPFGVICSFN